MDDVKHTARAWFGFAEQFNWEKHSYLGPFLSVLIILTVGALFILAISAAFLLLGSAVFNGLPQDSVSKFGLTGIIVAMIGAPFVVWRSVVAQKQVHVAEQGMITDRLNKAVEGLGAEKTVHRLGRDISYEIKGQLYRKFEFQDQPLILPHDAQDIQRTTWTSYSLNNVNLEVRIGAIYAMERIAQDSLRDHVQIMEILCAYVRENSPSHLAMQSPHEVFASLTEDTSDGQGLNAEAAFADPRYQKSNLFGWNPTELTENNLNRWARSLPRLRNDIQAVLTVIGRRKSPQIMQEDSQNFRIDLQHCNLQQGKLRGFFDHADLTGCRLDACELMGSFRDCNASYSNWQSACARDIDLTNSDFSRANLSATFFGASSLNRARFWFATMNHTNFNGAEMLASDWFHSFPRNIYFHQNADASYSRFQDADITQLQGIEDGPTAHLWGDSSTIGATEIEHKFANLSSSRFSELDFRREWLSSLPEAVLTRSK